MGYYVAGPPLLNGMCTSLLRAPVSEMTYTVSSGTLNPSIPYHTYTSSMVTMVAVCETVCAYVQVLIKAGPLALQRSLIHSNYGHLVLFRDKRRYWSRNANFSYVLYLWPESANVVDVNRNVSENLGALVWRAWHGNIWKHVPPRVGCHAEFDGQQVKLYRLIGISPDHTVSDSRRTFCSYYVCVSCG